VLNKLRNWIRTLCTAGEERFEGTLKRVCSWLNLLTLELNPSAQRCLPGIFNGDFALLIYAWKTTNTPIIHSVYWLWMVAPTRFGIVLPSSATIRSIFWEMLKWGAVYRRHWTQHAHPQYSIDCSSI
jgi:hypothetical protein